MTAESSRDKKGSVIDFFNLRSGKKDSTDSSREVLQKTEQVRLSEELLEDYDHLRQDWSHQVIDDDNFRNNNQMSEEVKNQLKQLNQSPVTFNIIHPTVELAKQMLTANEPKFQAAAREDSDVESARFVSDVLTYIWQNSGGDSEFARVVDDFYVRSMGVPLAYVNPDGDMGRGEVEWKAIDPLKVFIDPSSQDRYARDAAHIMIHELMTPEQVQQFEPFVEDILDKAETSLDDKQPNIGRRGEQDQQIGTETSVETDYYEVIDRYSRVKKERFHVEEFDSGREYAFDTKEFEEYKQQRAVVVIDEVDGRQVTVDEDEIAELMDMYERTGGVFHYLPGEPQQLPNGRQVEGQPIPVPGEPTEGALPNSRVEIIPSTIGEELDDVADIERVTLDRIRRVMSVGGVEIVDTIMEIDTYPIVPIMNRHNRNPYPLSDVRFVKGPQKQYNKIMSDILAHLSNSKSTRVLVPRGSDRQEIETLFSKTGVAIAEYDADIGTPTVVQPTPLPNEIYVMPQKIKQEVQRIFGIYDMSAGNAEHAPETVRGTVLIDEFGQRSIGPKMKVLYAGLEILGDVCLQLAQKTYTKKKVIRLFQPNMNPRKVVINEPVYHEYKDELIERHNDITIGQYDVQIVGNSTLPNSRWGRFEYYKELYQMGLIDQVEMLKQTDVADIEGVLNRSSEMQKMKQLIQQQQEEIKDLKGDLQTADREAQHANKRAELQKFKANLDAKENKVEKETELFKDRLNDRLKNKKDQVDDLSEMVSSNN